MVPKFRAWDKENKVMLKVDSIDFEYELININGLWRAFEHVVLMQSTGLIDKNGVEIFKGDVVKIAVNNGFDYLENELTIVKESDYYSGLICKLVSADLEYRIFDEEAQSGYQYVIVGNFYENPELLEVKA